MNLQLVTFAVTHQCLRLHEYVLFLVIASTVVPSGGGGFNFHSEELIILLPRSGNKAKQGVELHHSTAKK